MLRESTHGEIRKRQLEIGRKTAFLSKNRRVVNEGIISAYRKRSAFIHGSPNPSRTIVKDDSIRMQGTVMSILRRLMQFREKGYTRMNEVNEYVEKLKFGENNA